MAGVTVVQYRDKTSDTGDLIKTAKALHQRCRYHNVPLIINDRVDVALAVGCEGVHLGQDDMNLTEARKLLGDDKIIGATVSSTQQARTAMERGADYLGIGTLYATSTKKNTKDIIGINGIRNILHDLDQLHIVTRSHASQRIQTVCIGGVNALNVQRVQYQLCGIAGVAVVSAIIGASDVEQAAANLKTLLSTEPKFERPLNPWKRPSDAKFLHENFGPALHAATLAVHTTSPLSHNMTNLVVQNFAASVALAIGASPIMSNSGAEAPDLAALAGGLVINMGTATPDALLNHRLAIAAYNAAGAPVILDPVGAGATSARKDALALLMAAGFFTLIKGNEREILAVAQASGLPVSSPPAGQQRGVDSGDALFSLGQRAAIVSGLASRERNLVLMTGPTDIISDGHRTFAINNGHAYLGMITGSGCTLGTVLSAYLAVAAPGDGLQAAIAGILHFELAAEKAAARPDVKGPGTFVPAFVDELWRWRMDVVEGRRQVMQGLKMEELGKHPESVLDDLRHTLLSVA